MFKLTIIPAIALAFFSACIQSQQVPEHSYPAEWESHEAIWLGFRSHEEAQDSVTVPMLRALTRHVDVHLVVESDSLIPDGIGFLANEGVDTSRVAVFLQSPTDFWFRDPGPIFLRQRGRGLAVADFLYSQYSNVEPDSFSATAVEHEKIDEDVAYRLGLPMVESRVVMEGGSIEVNGRGTLILSELTSRRNPHLSRVEIEDDLKQTLGQRHIIWLDEGLAEDPLNLARIVEDFYGFGTGGHTDEFVRFVDDHTVLLAWVNEAERNIHPINAMNHKRMSKNFEILSKATDQDGQPFQIIRIPVPEVYWEDFLISEKEVSWFQALDSTLGIGDTVRWVAATSYLNFVITNDLVLLPMFWCEGRTSSQLERDEHVCRLFESIFPNREIIQINVLELNKRGGGMHCITQQQPTRFR